MPGTIVGALACTANPVSGTVRCDPDRSSLAARRHGLAAMPVIVGGQGQFVNVLPSNGQRVGTTFSFEMDIQNLLAQAMGTPDGTTLTGIQVFFQSGPTNNVTLDNADGIDTFTAANQPYFDYNQILDRGETTLGTRIWTFGGINPTAPQSFDFGILIQAELSNTILDAQYCGTHPLQKLDVHYPDEEEYPPPRPVIVYIHGGAWTEITADKSGGEHEHFTQAKNELLSRGYVFASINYRLSPPGGNTTFPTHIEDAKCAVRHLRFDALRYRIDPDRIGTWGHSAGAHLAALLGTAPEATFPVAEFAGTSSSVQAVVTQAAITDLTHPEELLCLLHSDPDCLLVSMDAAFPGFRSGNDELAEEASPVTYAPGTHPPFLVLHGDSDEYVRSAQATRLFDALGGFANGHNIWVVPGAFHSFSGIDQDTRDLIVNEIAGFFDAHLGN
ncbi:MAG TPA: alpha/beta hydrolase [Gemmatimonadaceae bacterium]|nr:alpha/beta hydrolase [Gemmatimonadaceae bacterium]